MKPYAKTILFEPPVFLGRSCLQANDCHGRTILPSTSRRAAQTLLSNQAT